MLVDKTEQDGAITIAPISVYPKKYLDTLRDEIEQAKIKITSGKQPVFDSVDTLIAKLEES